MFDESHRTGMQTILLIDDDARDRELAVAALERAHPHLRIRTAAGGEQAIQLLQGQAGADLGCPDLVILDYKMPRISGADVLRAIRSDPQACRSPIVVFSGSDSERDIEECYALGANAYVRKPASHQQLAKTLSTIASFWTNWNMPARH